MEENKEALLDILKELHPDVDFENETNLIGDKVLDSFDIVSLVTEIGDEFDVEIGASDLLPENFNSVDAMLKLIEKKQNDED